MATTDEETPEARLVLPGSGTAPARVRVVHLPESTRFWRTLLVVVLTLVLAPLSFLLPPHLLWPLIVLAAGLYLARRYWVGEYRVVSFEGECPRCESTLEISEGSRIRGRHTLECYSCHRQPELVIDDARD